MIKYNLHLIFTSTLILMVGCHGNYTQQENLLTAKPHIEDSICYNVPKSSRLCDHMKVEKQFVTIGDCKLYCEVEGEGVPLVLIHGGPGGTHHCFHPWLTAASKQFKVIYYDQRGCGLSDFKAGEGYSFEQTVKDLENLRKALKIDKWIVMGHSFGGAVAQFYTIKYPRAVIGQILVGSVPMINNPELKSTNENWFLNKQEKQKADEILQLIIAGKLTYEQYFYNSSINGGWKRQNFVKPTVERQAQMASYDIVFDKAFSSDFDSYNFEHAFDNCPIPTLICEGKYDSLWSAKKVPLFRKNHPNSTFKQFEESSHNIYSDEPELFVNTVSSWANSIKVIDNQKVVEWQTATSLLLRDQLCLIDMRKEFIQLVKKGNIVSIKQYYDKFKMNRKDIPLFSEPAMNSLAYSYLSQNKLNIAIELFTLIMKEYPLSWNAFDSLGEAYLKAGKNDLAIANYKKSVELNPRNKTGIEILKKLEH